MTIREAERVIVQRARRLVDVLRGPVTKHHPHLLEASKELMVAVEALEEAEKGARFAAKRHTEGGEW